MSDNKVAYFMNPTLGFYIEVDEKKGNINVCQLFCGEIEKVVLSRSEALELSRALADIAGSRSNG